MNEIPELYGIQDDWKFFHSSEELQKELKILKEIKNNIFFFISSLRFKVTVPILSLYSRLTENNTKLLTKCMKI